MVFFKGWEKHGFLKHVLSNNEIIFFCNKRGVIPEQHLEKKIIFSHFGRWLESTLLCGIYLGLTWKSFIGLRVCYRVRDGKALSKWSDPRHLTEKG